MNVFRILGVQSTEKSVYQGGKIPFAQTPSEVLSKRIGGICMNAIEFQKKYHQIIENCSQVIVGKENELRLVCISFLCSGHVLLEDLPGTGKTTLLKAFAKTIGQECKRIQFTPDLLPSDITGIRFYNQKTEEFSMI